MAEFTTYLQPFRPSFHFIDIDPCMEQMNQFTQMSILENSNLNLQSSMPFSCDTSLGFPEPQFERKLEESFPSLVHQVNQNALPVSSHSFPENEIHESKKRKPTDVLESSSTNSTSAISESGSKMKNVSS